MSDSIQSATALQQLSDNLADAVEKAGAWTVTVNARRRFPATGIVWNEEGLIVTANHVVEVDEEITVGLPDGRTVDAKLVGRDPSTDLALLSIEGSGLTSPTRAASEPRPGNLALAIGRPGPSGPMASFGVISVIGSFGRRRGRQGTESGDQFIRADVAMLPGFSGGPLVDAAGNLLGLNSSHFGRGGGLTITAAAIDKTVASLKTHGKIRRGFLGIGAQAVPIPASLAASAGTTQESGLVIVSIESGGPAETSGVLLGDIILSITDRPVGSVEELQDVLSDDLVGQPATLSLIRGGSAHSLTVTVAERGG
jgi:S1-C subfamily serine protease